MLLKSISVNLSNYNILLVQTLAFLLIIIKERKYKKSMTVSFSSNLSQGLSVQRSNWVKVALYYSGCAT